MKRKEFLAVRKKGSKAVQSVIRKRVDGKKNAHEVQHLCNTIGTAIVGLTHKSIIGNSLGRHFMLLTLISCNIDQLLINTCNNECKATEMNSENKQELLEYKHELILDNDTFSTTEHTILT